MADPAPSVRQRKPEPVLEDEKPRVSKPKKQKTEDDDPYTPWVDILRVLTFLFVASCGLSYLISSGETWFWGMKNPPNYLRSAWWKSHFTGPQTLTLTELAQYDGKNPDLPIYLSINGTIYDVSAGSRIYGPGGSYNIFAGVDASRGFVTGCFADDRNGDMRGVEDMFLPLDDPEVDKHWSKYELRKMKEKERDEALKRVDDALKHWVDFFRKSTKYHYVGKLVREEGWEGERKPLCKIANDGRSPRTVPGTEDAPAS